MALSDNKKSLDEDTTDPGNDTTLIMAARTDLENTTTIRACLIVQAGAEIGREIELHGRNQILGRSPLVNEYIDSPSVSRAHAQIHVREDKDNTHFEIQDLGSSNGTRVNGALQTRSHLQDGDKVHLGDVLFKFVLMDDADTHYHKEVHRRIHYDQLTGLLTMDAFRNTLNFVINQGTAFTLAMTDLDGLKKVNDTYGHLAGRMIIREMGVLMRSILEPQDRAGLYGGDEAIFLYPDMPLEATTERAEKLRCLMEEKIFKQDGHTFSVTISQGLAHWPTHGASAEDMIRSADRALYQAKADGRNCIRCFHLPD